MEAHTTTDVVAGKVATAKAVEERETQSMVRRLKEECDRLTEAIETDESKSVKVLTDRDVAGEERDVACRVVLRLTAPVEAAESALEEVMKELQRRYDKLTGLMPEVAQLGGRGRNINTSSRGFGSARRQRRLCFDGGRGWRTEIGGWRPDTMTGGMSKRGQYLHRNVRRSI